MWQCKKWSSSFSSDKHLHLQCDMNMFSLGAFIETAMVWIESSVYLQDERWILVVGVS